MCSTRAQQDARQLSEQPLYGHVIALNGSQAKSQVDEQARQRADAAAAQQVAVAGTAAPVPAKGPDSEAATKPSLPENTERSQVHAMRES
jgi:hypothetical protein